MATVTGYVERIKYRNEDNGYSVLSVADGGEEYILVGTFPYISEGERIEATGRMVEHSNTLCTASTICIAGSLNASSVSSDVTTMVFGRPVTRFLPRTSIVVTSDETLEALREPAMQIVDAVHNVLERTPPELAADIFDRGIVLTGGGSLISGLDALIEEKTGITTMIAEEPLTAVAIGTGKFIEFAHGGKGAEK